MPKAGHKLRLSNGDHSMGVGTGVATNSTVTTVEFVSLWVVGPPNPKHLPTPLHSVRYMWKQDEKRVL